MNTNENCKKPQQLIFYGPTGVGSPPDKIGGGEKGCQRTIALYKKLGVNVIIIEKPTLFKGKVAFIIDSLKTPFLLMRIIIANPYVPVHIVGFYENQMFYEYMIFLISRFFGRKTVYELRNGTMVKTLGKHSWLYRAAMKAIVSQSSAILCQGLEYVDYIAKTWKTNKIIYYPNYIMSSFIHPYHEQRAD